MSQTIAIKVPDIGNFKEVPVIEVLVKPGDTVAIEQSLITLETDKATMDVPAPVAGVVKELMMKAGDKVSAGVVFLIFDARAQPPPPPPLSGGEAAPSPEKGRAGEGLKTAAV